MLEQFRGVYQVGDRPTLAHFLLISMDDLLHIIAPSGATAMWVEGLGESTHDA